MSVPIPRFWLAALVLAAAMLVAAPAAQAAEHELLASDAAVNDQLGTSVAIDGDVAVVGAPHDNVDHGAAYVYVNNGGVWTQAAKLVASDGANPDQFGTSVAIKGDVVAVGAPSKNVGEGAAYVFVKPPTGWSAPPATPMFENAKLTPGGAASLRGFGFSIDVGGSSGDVVVVGAPNESMSRGSLYVFVRPGATWSGNLNENAKLTAAVADAAAGDLLGASSAINEDASIVAGGALSDDTFRGSVRLFLRPAGGWSGAIENNAKLIAGDGTSGDNLGFSTDISGQTVVSGARGDDSQRGSAYVFVPPGGGWVGIVPNVAKLVASEGTPGDEFGFAVAIDGTRAVVGAPLDDFGGDSLYVYDRPPGGWAGTTFESAKLVSTTGARGDRMGHSAGISRNVAIAGAPFRDEARGAAVILDLEPTRVTIRSVSAQRSARGVLVRWRTAVELGSVGFNVYRERAGKRVRVNRAVVRTHGVSQGRGYAFLDRAAPKGAATRYWVQSLNRDGTQAWHGPARVR